MCLCTICTPLSCWWTVSHSLRTLQLDGTNLSYLSFCKMGSLSAVSLMSQMMPKQKAAAEQSRKLKTASLQRGSWLCLRELHCLSAEYRDSLYFRNQLADFRPLCLEGVHTAEATLWWGRRPVKSAQDLRLASCRNLQNLFLMAVGNLQKCSVSFLSKFGSQVIEAV